MKRRNFITKGMVLTSATISAAYDPFFSSVAFPLAYRHQGAPQNYLLPTRVEASNIQIPENMRLPFGWRAFGLQHEPVILHFRKPKKIENHRALFRVSVAIDVREEKLIEVFLPQSRKVLGTLDIRYSPVFQPFQLELSPAAVDAVFEEGISLQQTKGDSPVWFFQPDQTQTHDHQGLLPHLLIDTDGEKPLEAFYTNFLSLNSVQSFGWMEGCVLDGMLDLHRHFPRLKSKKAINKHLRLFFDKNKNLIYEGPFSKPYDGRFYNIEALLPVATIAQMYPDHPVLQETATYCLQKRNEEGLITNKDVTTEGCYVVAYPLAALSKALQQSELAQIALQQLLIRQEMLVHEGHIYQKKNPEGQLLYRNWARGVAWYLLGTVRTLDILCNNPEIAQSPDFATLKDGFAQGAAHALRHQQPNGLWRCFLDDPATEVDTSGSAGIGAAIAIGIRRGWLPGVSAKQLSATRDALLQHLTPDGFLTGAAQANKGGKALQQSSYRVISQYASGLLAQLLAALP